jgi:hypothetical protein
VTAFLAAVISLVVVDLAVIFAPSTSSGPAVATVVRSQVLAPTRPGSTAHFRRPLAAPASERPGSEPQAHRSGEPTAPETSPPPSTVSGAVAGLAAWLTTSTARYVAQRESGWNRPGISHAFSCAVVDPSSTWFGKWQFDIPTWLSNGGGRFAPVASQATCAQQDLIAYRTWQRRGRAPWGL